LPRSSIPNCHWPVFAHGHQLGHCWGARPSRWPFPASRPKPFPKRNSSTSSLIPAFSPRRRSNARRLFEKPATGLAERSFAKPEASNAHFLSPGERIKGEGERQHKRSSAHCPVRPPQTAIGRCLRTVTNWDIAGERARPGGRFRRRAQNRFPNGIVPRPPSSRPSPQGEGATRAVFLKNPRLDWPNDHSQNRRRPTRISSPRGRG